MPRRVRSESSQCDPVSESEAFKQLKAYVEQSLAEWTQEKKSLEHLQGFLEEDRERLLELLEQEEANSKR